MTTEPLAPLTEAVSYEVDRLIREYQRHGMALDLVVSVDQTAGAGAGAVIIRGGSLALWGTRQRLEALLTHAALPYEVRMSGPTVAVFPTTT
jgi:hypothetical protein